MPCSCTSRRDSSCSACQRQQARQAWRVISAGLLLQRLRQCPHTAPQCPPRSRRGHTRGTRRAARDAGVAPSGLVHLGDIGADIAVRLLDPPGHVEPLVRRHGRSALPAYARPCQPHGKPPVNHAMPSSGPCELSQTVMHPRPSMLGTAALAPCRAPLGAHPSTLAWSAGVHSYGWRACMPAQLGRPSCRGIRHIWWQGLSHRSSFCT